jgi:hypothetical protein
MIILRRTFLASCVGCLLLMINLAGARPAGAPSFAGTWALNLPKSDFGSLQRPNFTMTRTVTLQGTVEIDVSDQITRPELVEMLTDENGTSVGTRIVQKKKVELETVALFTDGRYSSITTPRAGYSAIAIWKGSSLLVAVNGTHSNESDNGTKSESAFSQQQEWSLTNNGKTLRIKQTTNFGQNSNTVTYIFDRTS